MSRDYLITGGYYSLNLFFISRGWRYSLKLPKWTPPQFFFFFPASTEIGLGKCMQVSRNIFKKPENKNVSQLHGCQPPADSFFTANDIFALLFYIIVASLLKRLSLAHLIRLVCTFIRHWALILIPNFHWSERNCRKTGESRVNSRTLSESSIRGLE